MFSTLNVISTLLAPLFTVSKTVYSVIQIALMVCMVVCAAFAIVVILFQPGNSQGSAVTGQSETFLGKNKSNSFEAKLKRLTVVALVVIMVFSVLFFLVASEILIGVGAIIA